MSSNGDFLNKIAQLQNDYYVNNGGKNILFKKSQKEACATTISKQIGIEEFLSNLVYIIPNEKNIHMDYVVFKSFVNPSNYNITTEYIINKITYIIKEYGPYKMYVNLDGLTISAVERYKDFLIYFMKEITKKYTENNINYVPYLEQLHIYNAPNVFEQILPLVKPFLDDEIVSKMIIYKKEKETKR
jgi:hypothetical protein